MEYFLYPHMRNKYYSEVKDLPAPLRESRLFQYCLEETPVFFRDTDRIAGWYGYEDNAPEPLPPSPPFPGESRMTPEDREMHAAFQNSLAMQILYTNAHTCINYGEIVDKGLRHFCGRVEEALRETPDNVYLQAMRNSLDAAIRYAGRYAELAKQYAENSRTEEERARFRRIYRALCQVPEHPARDFLEGVQAVWLLHTMVPIADRGYGSISLGRLDQYLYPLYRKAVADGWDREEIKDILKNLFRLLDTYGDGACALNLGGMDASGSDQINDLSRVILEVEKEMQLRAPIIAVRVTPAMPEDFLDSCIDYELFRIGQPTFYGEVPCRKAVMERGIDEETAASFSANSCMGLMLAGQEIADMWGIKLNMLLALEMAVNHGEPFHMPLPESFRRRIRTVSRDIAGFSDLMEQYAGYLRDIVDAAVYLHERDAAEAACNAPDPFLSALTEGCIARRKDRAEGAEYYTVTVETLGFVNTCDALQAIRELVFEQKKYTLAEMVRAAVQDYADTPILLQDIRNCRKYGSNDPDCNQLCTQLSDLTADLLESYHHDNVYYLPSLHTIDIYTWYGRLLSASLDGRHSGEPVNKNANPSHLHTRLVPTEQIQSAAAVRQTRFSGGQPIDVYFEKSWFRSPETRESIKSLIRVYFELGGLQLQVNSTDIELLEKAHREPEKYPHVIIRKGGYSVYFTEQSAQYREDFIRQAKASSL